MMKVKGPAATKLVDVAKAAGVSRGTASNVFAHPELVRPEVRERVQQTALALGYSGPDPKGRLLRDGKANAIAVVSDVAFGLANFFRQTYFREFMAGVGEVCDEEGTGLALISAGDDEAWTRGIRNALVDGFIVHGPEDIARKLLELAKRRNLPSTVVDIDAGPDVSSIGIDNRGGARASARHLLGLGHRRFAIFSMLLAGDGRSSPLYHGPARNRRLVETFAPTRERLLGFADGLAEAGISIDDVPIVESFLPLESASDAASVVLDMAPETTAVLTMADTLALAVMTEARRRRIAVPADLSVIGFDDIPEAAQADPPLTTVAQPTVEKGRVAARMLFEGGSPRHEILPVKLIVRGSTAPPPRR